MHFYILHPDLALRKKPPHWQWEPGKWYAGVDLPPGLFWHPTEYKGWARRDLPALPGERLELVSVLTDGRSKSYRGIPLRVIRDRVRVLRRVRLTKDYTYEELYRSPLYRQWLREGVLQPYDLRAFAQVRRKPRPAHARKEVR